MKLSSNVCNRCRLVCVKFYLNRSRFAVVVAKSEGAHFFWDTRYKRNWMNEHDDNQNLGATPISLITT